MKDHFSTEQIIRSHSWLFIVGRITTNKRKFYIQFRVYFSWVKLFLRMFEVLIKYSATDYYTTATKLCLHFKHFDHLEGFLNFSSISRLINSRVYDRKLA
jgi:hypothetical protein